MNKIYIYDDLGSSKLCTNELFNCFRSIFSTADIRKINGNDILKGILPGNDCASIKNSILCIGGGYDLGFLESLKGKEGCDEIKRYVQAGGNYLGICAGAYLACDFIEFDLGGPLEVKGERFLNFFKGKACGPINQPYIYSQKPEELHLNSLCATIKLTYEEERFYTYLNGGNYFLSNTDAAEDFVVLANYENFNTHGNGKIMERLENKSAIVKIEVGLGRCLLSGVHFEFEANDFEFIEEDFKDNLISNYRGKQLPHSNFQLIKSLFIQTFGSFN